MQNAKNEAKKTVWQFIKFSAVLSGHNGRCMLTWVYKNA